MNFTIFYNFWSFLLHCGLVFNTFSMFFQGFRSMPGNMWFIRWFWLFNKKSNILIWSIFRSLVFLLIQMILPLYFTHVALHVDLVFALLLAIWWFCFGFGLCEWKREEKKASSWFQWKVNFFENLIFSHFYDNDWYIKNDIHHISFVKI